MQKYLVYLFILVLAACKQDKKRSPNVFFAGEIVNPNTEYVVLYKNNEVVDSAKLDDKNHFSFELSADTKGLHHFETSRELQYVFFESGDSIQLRLNTMDFDESLVFSGQGAEINNFLLDLFLANEKEEITIQKKYFQLPPDEFFENIEQLRQAKLADLDQLKSEVNLTPGAYEIAEVSINYTYYNYNEKYPFEHQRKTGKKILNALPSSFYAYRNDVNYNLKGLSHLTPYYHYIHSHFNHLSYTGCESKCGVHDQKVIDHLHFNQHKLNLIDSLVKEPELKDNLFRKVAFDYLLMSGDNEANTEVFIKDFRLKSANNKHIEEINELYEGIRNIQPEKQIPDIQVTDIDGNEISLQEIAKEKKVVFYFWSAANKRYFKDINKRVKQLQATKKDYTFVGINVYTDKAVWKSMIVKNGLNPAHQYRSDNFEKLQKGLVLNKMNKCIITEDAKIVDAFTTMWAANF